MEGSGGEKERRISGRDLEVLGFVARFGVVPRSAVARWAGTAKTVTSEREKRLRDAGLLEVSRPWLSPEPVLVATGDGLAACGRPELVVARVSTRTLRHFAVAAHLAVDLERAGEELLSERQLLAHERAMGRRDFSIRLRGEEKHHRPDMVILPAAVPPASNLGRERSAGTLAGTSDAVAGRIAQGGLGACASAGGSGSAAEQPPVYSRPSIVEVELTAKGKVRLDEIVSGWAATVDQGRFSRVRYFCSAEALPYVKRSVDRTEAGVQVAAELLSQGSLSAAAQLA